MPDSCVPLHALHALMRLDSSAFASQLVKRACTYVPYENLGDFPTECFLPAMEDVLARCGGAVVVPLIERIQRALVADRETDYSGTTTLLCKLATSTHDSIASVFSVADTVMGMMGSAMVRAAAASGDCALVDRVRSALFELVDNLTANKRLTKRQKQAVLHVYDFLVAMDTDIRSAHGLSYVRRALHAGFHEQCLPSEWMQVLIDLGIEPIPGDPLLSKRDNGEVKVCTSRRRTCVAGCAHDKLIL